MVEKKPAKAMMIRTLASRQRQVRRTSPSFARSSSSQGCPEAGRRRSQQRLPSDLDYHSKKVPASIRHRTSPEYIPPIRSMIASSGAGSRRFRHGLTTAGRSARAA
jgi:hypothetical protein